ncbi:MAG: hypothetical protein UT61_C0012G0001, partial [Candidatus Woesebacteria bacterium GW2011_GWA1_39_8]
ILIFGVALLIPKFQILLETIFSKLSGKLPQQSGRTGFWGGFIIGISIGLLWTPCVGPILAAVISLALTGSVTGTAVLITLAYSLGTGIPMFAILYGGRNLLNRVPWLTQNTAKIQRAFGVLMVITAFGIFFNLDRKFQTYIINRFPSYGVGLTQLEENAAVKQNLDQLNASDFVESRGKPMFDMTSTASLAPELITGGKWFNTSGDLQGLPNAAANGTALKSLRGKVVLIDFWTYTCINCIRTLPYLKSWDEKYRDKGLVIIGVHTPEFEFEKDAGNVEKAIRDFGINYPVMQDNNYATWRAYNNRYWPAEYFINKDGEIVHTHFGEGKYDESEAEIQKLLEESGSNVSDVTINNPTYNINSQTPETYIGYARQYGLVSPESLVRGSVSSYSAPRNIALNSFAFVGNWHVGSEYAMPQKGSSLIFNFSAQKVYLVMRPIKEGGKVRVFLDDELILESAGEDVLNGEVSVDTDRLYNLVNLQTPGSHLLKLEFLDSNLEVYAFTFG